MEIDSFVIPFVNQYFSDVKRFCIEDLAGILYRCVEYKDRGRTEVDWFTAEKWINQQPVRTFDVLTEKFLYLTGYEELRKNRPHLPKINTDIYGKAHFKEIDRIKERLIFLNNNEFSDLISKLDTNERRDYQKKFLGREVWDEFYQKILNKGLHITSDFLYPFGYGKVLFS